MSTNGTATIETVAESIPLAEVTSITVAEVVQATRAVEASQTLPAPPTERPSALDQALGWVADVVKMRDALAEEERTLADRLDRVRSTRARLGQVVAIFEAPAPSVEVATPAPATAERRRSPAPLSGRWSRKHEACVICGRADRPHKGKGRCSACYDRADRAKSEAEPS